MKYLIQPYSGVKTSIVIFTKTGNGGTDKVWFYNMENDGFTLDVKRDAIDGSDIPDLIQRFHSIEKEVQRTRKDKSFLVGVDEIRNKGYDLTFAKYKEIKREEIVFRNTIEILNDIETANSKVVETIQKIKEMIGE